MNTDGLQVVGIIPAAGNASRIAPIPCSKEIFPVGFQGNSDSVTVKVAATHILESLTEANASQAYMIIRKGKWDIPQYLGMGNQPGYSLAYIISEPTPGTHYTIDLAYRFVKDKLVILGFPDILFKPKNAFAILLDRQRETGAEIVLGLFKTDKPHKGDMVVIDERGRIKNIIIKPSKTDLIYCWAMAAWTPVFTEYLHASVARIENKALQNNHQEEIYIGHVIREAIKDGFSVEGVIFKDGFFVDIGTVPDLKNVLRSDF